MSRELLPSNIDKSVFKATAMRTKKINARYSVPRGGFRM